MKRVAHVVVVVVLAVSASIALPGFGVATEFFTDVPEAHVFFKDIAWLGASGITRGCNPPANDAFCPDDYVTRGQMAAFLSRGFGLAATEEDFFTDDDDSVFESDINRLAAAGVTRGCNPPANDQFCPSDSVTREQMASFLVRALNLGGSADDVFVDDDYSVHEVNINRLYEAGITRGCNPPANDRFCPAMPVSRGEMAAFLHRALGGGILGGHVFEDVDLDGLFEAGEPPIPGVTVFLEGTPITRRSAVSDARGGFAFGPLEPGEYMVSIGAENLPAGSQPTNDTWHVVDVYETTSRLDLDLGLRTPDGIEAMMVGTWEGTNTNPWVDPYDIEIEFRSDGTYSSHTDAANWALYFAPDEDTPLKTYRVTSVGSGGVAQGEIAFVWVISDSMRAGAMTAIEFTGDDHLTIELWDRGTYGPVVLDLTRTTP